MKESVQLKKNKKQINPPQGIKENEERRLKQKATQIYHWSEENIYL